MKFDIKYNKDDNRIYIKSDFNKKIDVNLYKWNTTSNDIELLDKFEYYGNHFQNNINLHNLNGIKVEILYDNKIIKEEFIRFRSRYGDIAKKKAVYVLSTTGFGDTLTCTPIIKKLYEIYNQKLTIFTHLPEVFINNPYIDDVIKIDLSFEKEKYLDSYEIFDVFNTKKHNYAAIDLRQINAFNIGFQLKDTELDMEFFPDPYIDIYKLPKNYICINPSVTYTDRTWSFENWQKFITLIEKYIPVVAIGKITYYDTICPKTFHPVQIKNGLNLLNDKNANTLSQMYHIISKSETFVTMANGLHMLALSSDAHITQLGTPWDTVWYRTRNNIKNYNTEYVIGNCNIHCTSNLRMSVDEHNTHISPLYVHHNTIFSDDVKEEFKDRWWIKNQCYLGFSNYKCQPSPEQVFDTVIKILKNNKII